MKPSTMAVALGLLGFKPADQSLLSDRPIANLVYLTRSYGEPAQQQYVALCCPHDDPSRFLEAVLEVYERPRVARDRKPNPNLAPRILRSLEAILEAVDQVYALARPGKI